MVITINSHLSTKEMQFFDGFPNGLAIVSIVNELHEEGLESEIKVLGYDSQQSYIITKYEVYILEGLSKVRLTHSNLSALQSYASVMQRETTLGQIIADGRHK